MRIVSLAPSNTEILFALGAGTEIVGRTAYCDFPKEALKIPKIGDWVNPDIGQIERLKPDIVLTSTVVQEKLSVKLRDAGLNVLHLDPRTLEAVFGSMRRIGESIGRSDESERLIAGMKEGLREADPRPDGRPRIYIEEWHNPPFASGNWVPRIAQIAGSEYGLVKEGELSKGFPLDELKAFDPQIIVLSICGIKSDPRMIYGRTGWEGIRAVRSRKVFAFDDSLLNRPGPRLVEGEKLLRKLISSSSRTSC
jgi:iron complex transport system substrate-binding protein